MVCMSCSLEDESQESQINANSRGLDPNNYSVMDRGPERGGTLRLFSTRPDTLNPILTKNMYVQGFSSFIYESLVKIGKDQKPIPVLCDRWEVSEDGLIWTFYIKKGVLWHDGEPFTAGDVEFSIESILNAGADSVYSENLKGIMSFAALDSTTLRVVLKKPNSFLPELMTFPIMPRHCFETAGSEVFAENSSPIGTGPFKFRAYDKNKKISLVANDNWWNSNTDGNTGLALPYISAIEIKIYNSVKEEMGAFQSGETDVAFVDRVDYNMYGGRTDLSIKKYTGRNFEFIAFNLNNPVCAEKVVRQAFARMINRQGLINMLLPGKAVPSNLPVNPASWLYNSDSVAIEYDAEAGRKMLEEDGWQENENGILYKRIDGMRRNLRLEMLVNDDNSVRVAIAEYIREQLADTGIELKITALKWDEMIKRINNGKFDMVLMGCTIPPIPDISFLYSTPYLEPYSVYGAEAARNIAGYSNPYVDELINNLFSENDYDRKKAIFFNLQSTIEDELPYIGLFVYNNAVLLNRNVRGEIDPYVWDRFNNIAKWYVPLK